VFAHEDVDLEHAFHELRPARGARGVLRAADRTAPFTLVVGLLLDGWFGDDLEHWQHLRTTNPIESTFATVRLRTTKTKGCGSRLATLTMVFKLAQSAAKSWRRLTGSKLIADVIQGVQFKDGIKREAAA